MKINKILLAAILAFAAPGLASAAQSFEALRVVLTDGTSQVVTLSDDLKITTVDNELRINSASEGTAVVYDRDQVENILYVGSDADLGYVQSIGVDGSLRQAIDLCDIPAGTEVTVASIDGRLVAHYVTAGRGQIDLSSLATGVYIVKAGNIAVKIYKK
ncbi:MAG: T9SS type A sorting domain-containing protein [Bacteroidales bacterium]|nr:T9SS type A sorting domain-containing protein [Bacteroidales bacterium]